MKIPKTNFLKKNFFFQKHFLLGEKIHEYPGRGDISAQRRRQHMLTKGQNNVDCMGTVGWWLILGQVF